MTSARACRACNQLKVRCHPSSADSETCQRCHQAGRQCVPAGKRRRPRDRIADLEAQIEVLTRALQRQQLTPVGEGTNALAFLDAHVSLEAQQLALDTYTRHLAPILPLSTLLDVTSGSSLSSLSRARRETPLLLFSITTFAAAHQLPATAQNALLPEAMRIFGVELISRPRRRLELVCALLVAAYWFRAQRGSPHVTVQQMVQMATGMAIDLGLGGADIPVTPGSGYRNGDTDEGCHQRNSSDAQRAWLACFVAASVLSLRIRRYDTNALWTAHHEACLERLSVASPSSSSSSSSPASSVSLSTSSASTSASMHTRTADRLFLHMVRGEQLINRINKSLGLSDPTSFWNVTADTAHATTSNLKADLDDWRAEIASDPLLSNNTLTTTVTQYPPSEHNIARAYTKALQFTHHSALIHLHEPILHTRTNKPSFASFSSPAFQPVKQLAAAEPGRDFPAPARITGRHVAALFALRDACRELLDLVIGLGVGGWVGGGSSEAGGSTPSPASSSSLNLATCPLPYISRTFHSLLILAKLYVSISAPGNTYGSVLAASEMRACLERYLKGIKSVTRAVEELNPGSYNAVLGECVLALEGWFVGYACVQSRGKDGVGVGMGMGMAGTVGGGSDEGQDFVIEGIGQDEVNGGGDDEEEEEQDSGLGWMVPDEGYEWLGGISAEGELFDAM